LHSGLEISNRVAAALKIFEYAAILLLVLGIVIHQMGWTHADHILLGGIVLAVLAPIAGVVTAGVDSLRSGHSRIKYYSLIILIVYTVAYLIAR